MLMFIVHRSSFIVLTALISISGCRGNRPVVVGSKNFTESVILGEMLAQKVESAGCPADRRPNRGGPLVCAEAIRAGSLDTYVEYSGTALLAILREPHASLPD